jgi:hypothetical protein
MGRVDPLTDRIADNSRFKKIGPSCSLSVVAMNRRRGARSSHFASSVTMAFAPAGRHSAQTALIRWMSRA